MSYTFLNVYAHLNITGDITFTQRILITLEYLYDNSPTARLMLERLVDESDTLYIENQAGVFGANTLFLGIDFQEIEGTSYFDAGGNAVRYTDVAAIAHELVHAIEGLDDDLEGPHLSGETVDRTNLIHQELGILERLSYPGFGEEPDFEVGENYTNYSTIDVAINVESSEIIYSGLYDVANRGHFSNSRDLIIGNESNDQILSRGGSDYLYGLGGNDTLQAGAGEDLLMGGAGADLLLGGAGGDTLNGGDDFDTASYEDASSPVVIDLVHNVNGGDAADDVYISIERYVGSKYADAMYGSDEDDHFEGGRGNDVIHGDALLDTIGSEDLLHGGQGNDFIWGGAGNDSLLGEEQNDFLEGGLGQDTLYGGTGNDVLEGGFGGDFLYGGAGYDGYVITLDSAFQHDLIRDIGGKGELYILDGGYYSLKGAVFTYNSANDNWDFTYTKSSGTASGTAVLFGNDLRIRFDADNYLTIKNFAGGQSQALAGNPWLGISLQTPNEPYTPPGPDSVPALDDPDYDEDLDPEDSVLGGGSTGNPQLDAINDNIEEALRTYEFSLSARLPCDPLVLDLDGDGIELIAQGQSNAYFDMNEDSFAERTGWISGDDGFLVQDLNSNGSIDDISEMFGNETMTGLEELALLDSNSDGVINASDTDFSTLRVWQDANEDGITDVGELHTLSSLGIETLHLASQLDGRFVEGSYINEVASFDAGAYSGQMAEVFFSSSLFDTQYIGDGGMDDLIDPTTLLLPESRGYGTLPSLAVAMTQDDTLRGMVEDLTELGAEDYTDARGQIEDILLQWADPASLPNVTNYSAERLAFLEAFTGRAFTNIAGTEINAAAIAFLDEAWDLVKGEMTFRLLVQGPMAEIFPNASYSYNVDELALGSDLDAIMEAVEASALGNNIHFLYDLREILLARTEEVDATQSEILSAISAQIVVAVGSADDATYGLAAKVAAFEIDNTREVDDTSNVYYTGAATGSDLLNEMIIGRDENTGYNYGDFIQLGRGGAYVLAGGGNDQIIKYVPSGHAEGDIILAGDGNDYINYSTTGSTGVAGYISGGAGNDRFAIDGDNHTVLGGEGNDSFEGISGNNILISGGEGNDTFAGGTTGYDGWTDRIIDLGAGDDIIWGRFQESVITLGDGHDEMAAGIFGDAQALYMTVMDGGQGDDILRTRELQDSTILGGEGNDIIANTWRIQQEFLLEGNGGDDQITFFYANAVNVSRAVLGGESEDTLEAVNQIYYTTIDGGEGDDQIYLGWNVGLNTVIGGLGDDTITVGYDTSAGNHFYFSEGDGHDVINYDTGIASIPSNTIYIDETELEGEASYVAANMWELVVGAETFELSMDSGNLVITRDGIATDSLTIADFDTVAGAYGITLAAGPIDQTVTGTMASDTIAGAAGNDLFDGGGGDDSITGGDGNDSITGGTGADTLEGNVGTDLLYGDEGTDLTKESTVTGGGADLVLGGDGNDTIYSESGNDTVRGGAGFDILYSGSGTDEVTGGADNDNMYAGMGNDTMYGDEGTDLAADSTVTGGGNDYLDGGGDNDLIYAESGNDYVIGNGGADTIYGGSGADTLIGGSGVDTIYGGDANDTIYGGGGADLDVNSASTSGEADDLSGGAGSDYMFGEGGADTMDGGAGSDSLYGGSGNDALNGDDGTDLATDSTLTGGGNDHLDGGTGNDLIYGESGNDYIFGNDGADIMYGGAGTDTLIGGTGTDSIYGGDANDTIYGGIGDDLDNNSTSTGGESDYLVGGAGNDYMFGEGGTDTMYGGAGNDSMYGGSGADTMYGGDGNDQVAGGNGTDWLMGGLGDDLVIGGADPDSMYGDEGNDSIVGLGGADVYYFASGSGVDTISGFEGEGAAGGDVIRLQQYINGGSITTFAGLSPYITYNTGAQTASINLGSGNTILVQNVSTSFISSDFSFFA